MFSHNWGSLLPQTLCERALELVETYSNVLKPSIVILMQDADVKTEKLEAEDELQLRTTADWLDCPSSLILPFNGRTFETKVSGPHCLQILLHWTATVKCWQHGAFLSSFTSHSIMP